MRIDGPNFHQHRQPVHFGHPKVENRHAGIVLPEESQSVKAAGCRMHIVPMTRQHGLQEVAIHAVVVNDKDFDHRSMLREMSHEYRSLSQERAYHGRNRRRSKIVEMRKALLGWQPYERVDEGPRLEVL